MGGVWAPPGGEVVGEKLIHVDSPETLQKIKELQIKIYDLESAYNAGTDALKAELERARAQVVALEKARLAAAAMREAPRKTEIKYQDKIVEKIVEVPVQVFVRNKRLEAIIGAVAAALGLGAGLFF